MQPFHWGIPSWEAKVTKERQNHKVNHSDYVVRLCGPPLRRCTTAPHVQQHQAVQPSAAFIYHHQTTALSVHSSERPPKAQFSTVAAGHVSPGPLRARTIQDLYPLHTWPLGSNSRCFVMENICGKWYIYPLKDKKDPGRWLCGQESLPSRCESLGLESQLSCKGWVCSVHP